MFRNELIWKTALFLATLIILLSLLGTFHDDRFYDYGYSRNGAYEQLDEELVWSVTENFQSYLDDEAELALFDEQQASHLEDVKGLYRLGRDVARILLVAIIILFAFLADQLDRRAVFAKLFRRAGSLVLILTMLLGLSALHWEWFFTQFHELLFEGNWMFSGASLMMRLWGGSFFQYAAGYILIKNVVAAALCYLLSWLTSPRSASRSA